MKRNCVVPDSWSWELALSSVDIASRQGDDCFLREEGINGGNMQECLGALWCPVALNYDRMLQMNFPSFFFSFFHSFFLIFLSSFLFVVVN